MLIRIKSIIKGFILKFNDLVVHIFFSFLFIFIRRKISHKKYYISICAIFKNEGIYLKEWIEYHKLLGINHIYLYNNFSNDNYLEILNPYIKSNFVTLTEWPKKYGQISAYEDCFNNYRENTNWLVYLDLDEFICPLNDVKIQDWLQKFEKYPSIIIYWLMFGTNGITDLNPEKLVIEQYTHSWSNIRNVGKIILNTNYTPIKIYHHHLKSYLLFIGLKFKVPMINEMKRFISLPDTFKVNRNHTIQINHYWSKCLEEYVRKIDKGDMFSSYNDEIRKKMDFFYWHEYNNKSENKVIWRFLMELKIRINSIETSFKK